MDDDAVTPRIVAKLSSVLRQAEDLVTLRIKYYAYDRTDMRAVNNLLDVSESIPLETAETIIASVRQLLRSCGTTAFGSKADLKGHYSDYGRGVMNAARMRIPRTAHSSSRCWCGGSPSVRSSLKPKTRPACKAPS